MIVFRKLSTVFISGFCILLFSTSIPVVAADEFQNDITPDPYSFNEAPTDSTNSILDEGTAGVVEEAEDEDRSIGYRMLIYLPNRILDLFDIFRLRARVGPGIGLGIRATEPLSLNLSSYASVYAGLPGPRGKPTVRSPIGAELYSGASASVFGIETENYGPHYSFTEIGADVQLLIVGGSIGIDPLEILDFVTGFVGIEMVEDDL